MRRALPLVLVLLLAVAGCGGTPKPDGDGAGTAKPAFTQAAEPTPAASTRPAGRYLMARLKRPTQLRSSPGGTVLDRLGRRTEFGSHTVLAVVGRRDGWLRVITPRLPNHRRGWI